MVTVPTIYLSAALHQNNSGSQKMVSSINAGAQVTPWENELQGPAGFGYGSESPINNRSISDPLSTYIPKTELGRVLLAVRSKMKADGIPFLSMDEIDEYIGRNRIPD